MWSDPGVSGVQLTCSSLSARSYNDVLNNDDGNCHAKHSDIKQQKKSSSSTGSIFSVASGRVPVFTVTKPVDVFCLSVNLLKICD